MCEDNQVQNVFPIAVHVSLDSYKMCIQRLVFLVTIVGGLSISSPLFTPKMFVFFSSMCD
jgi:hypothetical protein